MGNLTSVKNAFLRVGAECDFIKNSQDISEYDKIVLPGVGAFGAMMEKLDIDGLKDGILEHIASGKMFMGICLGMQVLFERSYEFGETQGLGVLDGEVRRLPVGSLAVPNVGWWDLEGNYSEFTEKISDIDTFYFVHSYHCCPNKKYNILTINFNGQNILASVRHNNVIGYQFHPEKSQKSGQKLLKVFKEI